MVTCSVPGCTFKKGKASLFNFPKNADLLQKWLDSIPGLKPPVKNSWRVCEKHFKPGDIVFHFTHTIGGKVYLLKRDRPKLDVDAVPTKNLPAVEEIVNDLCQDSIQINANTGAANSKLYKRKLKISKKIPQQTQVGTVENNHDSDSSALKDCDSTPKNTAKVFLPSQSPTEQMEVGGVDQEINAVDISNAVTTTKVDITKVDTEIFEKNEAAKIIEAQEICNKNDQNIDSSCHHKTETFDSSIHPANEREENDAEAEEPFESLFDDVFEVILPSTLWGVHRSTNRNRIMFVCIDEDQLNISKMLIVDDTGNLKIYLNANLIRDERLLASILTTEYISDTLAELDDMQ